MAPIPLLIFEKRRLRQRLKNMYLDKDGNLIKEAKPIRLSCLRVPGTVKGLDAALEKIWHTFTPRSDGSRY